MDLKPLWNPIASLCRINELPNLSTSYDSHRRRPATCLRVAGIRLFQCSSNTHKAANRRCSVAALKPTQVLYMAHDLGALNENRKQRETRQRKGFLRELEAMIRLRSPNTVNVYGAVTSLSDRMALVMELLSNGDLLTLSRRSTKPLSEEKSRQIIGDICAGMAFLHGKNTVHG
ncbi:unnamed protein product, partial [Ectocarpus sp. 13 AM-2016]